MAVQTAGGKYLACPFFMPREKYDNGPWIHPARLPLAGGWKGLCTAPGHENAVPDEEQLRESCNLGYAANCAWRPIDRPWDSVRFGVSKECDQRIVLCYACEKEHRPVDHGLLEYDARSGRWNSVHSNAVIQKMAECYVESYLFRKQRSSSERQ